MKIKNGYSIIDIIGISLIFIVLIILTVPLIYKIANNYEYDSTRIKATALYNMAVSEYQNDTSLKREITAYCFRADYGYPKTLNDGTIRSIKNTDEGVSYYITFDGNGNITSFVYTDDNYGIDLRENINEITLSALDKSKFITKEDAFKIIEKCPYNSN